MKSDTTADMKMPQLRELARTLDIPGRSRMRKADLVAAITARQTPTQPEAPMQPGETRYRKYGTLEVRLDHHGTHIAITVDHAPLLDRALPLAQARDYCHLLRDHAGQQLWQIEAAAGAFTTALAVVDQAEQDLIDSINADLDADEATERQAAVQLHSDVQAIVKPQGWNQMRQEARRTTPSPTVVAAAKRLNTAHSPENRMARKTRPADPSEPMLWALTYAVEHGRNGIPQQIRRGGDRCNGDLSNVQLYALADMGLVTLIKGTGRAAHSVLAGELTEYGIKLGTEHSNQQMGTAA